jgi:hypothetical protein
MQQYVIFNVLKEYCIPKVEEEETGPDYVYQKTNRICGHLLYWYSVTVNQVIVATVELSKWWLQLD